MPRCSRSVSCCDIILQIHTGPIDDSEKHRLLTCAALMIPARAFLRKLEPDRDPRHYNPAYDLRAASTARAARCVDLPQLHRPQQSLARRPHCAERVRAFTGCARVTVLGVFLDL